jgi:hypothetical protein
MVACVHAVHTGLTPLRASRQRPIGKAKRRRGRTGRRTPAEETEATSRTSQRRRGRAGDGECDHLDSVPNVTSHPHMSGQPPFDIRRSDASDPPLSCLAAEGRSARERHHVSLLTSPDAHPYLLHPLALSLSRSTSARTLPSTLTPSEPRGQQARSMALTEPLLCAIVAGGARQRRRKEVGRGG